MDSLEETAKLLDTYRGITDSMSVSVKITYDQAIEIIVNDLIKKYRINVKRKDGQHWAEAFKTVLSYYLTESELEKVIGKQ